MCGICQEEAEDAIQSKCKHVFCREDVTQYIQSAPMRDAEEGDVAGASSSMFGSRPKGSKKSGPSILCPVCFKELTIDLSQPTASEQDVFGLNSSADVRKNTSIVNRIDLTTWRSSTKIEGMIHANLTS